MFSGVLAGAGMSKEEEAKLEARMAALKEQKEKEMVALRREWRMECNRLRAQGKGQQAPAVLKAAAQDGDAEAIAAMDKLAPVSRPQPQPPRPLPRPNPRRNHRQVSLEEFRGTCPIWQLAHDTCPIWQVSLEDFIKAKEEKEKAAQEAKEAAEKARRDADESARRAARSDVSTLEADDEDELLLKGVSKGYKQRADGSKTSYFDRSDSVDPKTKVALAPTPNRQAEPSPDPSPLPVPLPRASAPTLALAPPQRRCSRRPRRRSGSTAPPRPRPPAPPAARGTRRGHGRRRT